MSTFQFMVHIKLRHFELEMSITSPIPLYVQQNVCCSGGARITANFSKDKIDVNTGQL